MRPITKIGAMGSAALFAASLMVMSQPAIASAGSKQILTVAVDSNPTTMDPQDTEDTLSFSIQKTMYEGLLGFDQNMHVIPVLATGYQVNKSATSITFELRHGVKFEDGTPFNAEAVKVNVDRVRNPNNHLKRYSLYSMIKDVKVINPYKVQIDLSAPFGAIAANFAHPAGGMISPAAIKKYGAQVSHHPDGTGPFEFVSWQDGDQLQVKANPNYWGKKPTVAGIDFKFVPNSATRLAMLQTGQAQFVYPVSTDQVATVKSSSNIKVESKPSIIVMYVALNVTQKPFNNPLVRQALNYAIDKNALIKVTQNGYATPALSAIAPNTWGYAKQSEYKPNIAKAKQLLAKAGYPNGFSTTLWTDNVTEDVKTSQFIQQQLAQIGVNVNVEQYDGPTVESMVDVPQSKSKMAMNYTGWSPSTGDADWGLRPLLAKQDFAPVGYNIGFYSDPIVNNAIQAGLQTGDPAKRNKAYALAQKQIYKDAPWIFLDVPDNVWAYRSNVSNASVLPDGSLYLNNAVIK